MMQKKKHDLFGPYLFEISMDLNIGEFPYWSASTSIQEQVI